MNPRQGRPDTNTNDPPAQRIAVIGSGIAGLSAAWLLARRHQVTLFEAAARAGGHSNTVQVLLGGAGAQPVDTGFIVYNEAAYPNLSALFAHLGVPTQSTEMSFAVSLDDGALEYSGSDLAGLFAQRGNLVNLRFWSMLRDLLRFYREAPVQAANAGMQTLDAYLDARGYGRAFRDDHLYPMAAAIWSTPAAQIGRYPLAAFVRFCENHQLLKLGRREAWRTVTGGSREYVQRMTAAIRSSLRLGQPVVGVLREAAGVKIATAAGVVPERFDQVVIATHADQALQMLDQPTADEQRLLGAFGYSRNYAVLHQDATLMPQRRAVWSAWNYLADRGRADSLCVTYWMNRLQNLQSEKPLLVTLNPMREPRAGEVLYEKHYEHPLFDAAALAAQSQLWSLQGKRRSWFCGAYFGAGFHEDGLQAGLAVAEAIGGVRRPWSVPDESARIRLPELRERAS
ncbi:MAG: FAD-dependent oxidoreductase [Rhodocyclaceae bacterium]|nr:FAD-dependent oxidoreductase [Rhodocyclaceae bacterium]